MVKVAKQIQKYDHKNYLEPELRKLMESGESDLIDLTFDADEVALINIKSFIKPFLKDIDKEISSLVKYFEEDPLFQDLIAPDILRFHNLEGVKNNQVFVGDGNYGLFKEMASFLFDKTLMIGNGPQFPDFPSIFTALGGSYKPIFNKSTWDFPTEELIHEINTNKNVSVVFLDIPNNPTGAYILPQETERIIKAADRKGIIVLVDEAYANYLPPAQTTARLVNKYENLLVTRSFSKAFDLGGIRFGYTIMSPYLAGLFKKIHSPFQPTVFSVLFAKYFFQNYKKVAKKTEQSKAAIKKYREQLITFLGKKGIKALPAHEFMPHIMFYKKGEDLFKFFMERKIVVRSGKMYEFTCPGLGNEFIRLRPPLREDTYRELIKRLR